jgi:hypothetical protein
MSEVTDEDVREAFETADGPTTDADGFEVMNVERNRSQYRVFLDPEGATRNGVEGVLEDAFGEDAVFGVSVSDEMWGDDDVPVRVVSFRLR